MVWTRRRVDSRQFTVNSDPKGAGLKAAATKANPTLDADDATEGAAGATAKPSFALEADDGFAAEAAGATAKPSFALEADDGFAAEAAGAQPIEDLGCAVERDRGGDASGDCAVGEHARDAIEPFR